MRPISRIRLIGPNMPSPPKSIAFFDVDYTLIDGNSGFYTTLHLVKKGLMKKRRFLQAVYYSSAALLFDQDIKKIYQTAMQDLVGLPLSHVLKIGKECFEADIKRRFFVEGLRCVQDHQKRGDKVVVLSAGPSMTLYHVAQYLKADEAYMMGPEIQNEVLTNRLQLPLCHGEGKVHYAKLVCKKYGIPLKDCYFYTDDESDTPLLKSVGHPHVVNPGRGLIKISKRMGWKILWFEKTRNI